MQSADDARRRVLGIGAVLLRARRLQHDVIVDTPDGAVLSRGCTLRVRAESGRAVLTFKGPVQPGPLKLRDETETDAASAEALLQILAMLGYHPVFRYEKYREEFAVPGAVVAIDVTPIGAFLEIEGDEAVIHSCASRLGHGPGDYVTASYRALFVAAHGADAGDMVFARAQPRT